MKPDLAPGSVGDLHQLLERRWLNASSEERVDIIDYTQGRARGAAAATPLRRLALWMRARKPTAARWAKLAAQVALLWLVSAAIAHIVVSVFEGSPWPDDWGAAGTLACILLAAATAIGLAILAEDE